MVNSATPAEVAIDEPLVRALLRAQCPAIGGVATEPLPLVPFNNGWDNDIWSLGNDWLVRLPRRAAAAGLVRHEQEWLALLAPRLSIPVPAPVFAGVPGAGYPWHWSVVPRFPGVRAAEAVLANPEAEAIRLARFLRELHVTAPAGAPHNPFRGLPVAEIAGKYQVRRERQHERLVADGRDVALLDRQMAWGRAAPVHSGPAVMLHGDMHSANVIVDRGSISAVVDWGDICAGDPACDLQIAWMLFDADARDAFFGAYGEGEAGLMDRARAWAVHSALVYLDNDDGDDLMRSMGNAILDRLGA